MKISELINQLSKYPQDMNVFGYSDDLCMGEQIKGITLSETSVFIDSLDDSVCIAYESVIEDRSRWAGDTECYSVLIAYPSKINTNDIREGCESLDDLKASEDQWLNDLKAIEKDYDDDLKDYDDNLKSTLIISDEESV